MPRYKLLTWNDYSIPVPVRFKWMAQDKNGLWWLYQGEPIKSPNGDWWIENGRDSSEPFMQYPHKAGLRSFIKPPELGPWIDQIYWIG